jgi:hypothetical protein
MGKISSVATASDGGGTNSVSLWADSVVMKFEDGEGREYEVEVKDNGESIDVVMQYPDGQRVGLESVGLEAGKSL